MPTIERRPLPPPGSAATKITEADRAEIIARANDVIDYYLNGPGSYFAAGPRKPLTAPPKPLTGELGDSIVADLKKFKDSVIASKQFADDPGAIMGAVAELIDETIKQVQAAAQYSEGRNTILRPPPSIDDPIDDPRVTSPRQLNNAPLHISLPWEQAQPAAPLQAGAMPATTDGDVALTQGDSRNFHAATPPVRLGTSTPTNPRDIRVLSSPVLPLGASRTQLEIPNQTSQQTGRPLGIFTGQPIPNCSVPPPIFGLSDRPAASGDDMDDWIKLLIR